MSWTGNRAMEAGLLKNVVCPLFCCYFDLIFIRQPGIDIWHAENVVCHLFRVLIHWQKENVSNTISPLDEGCIEKRYLLTIVLIHNSMGLLSDPNYFQLPCLFP